MRVGCAYIFILLLAGLPAAGELTEEAVAEAKKVIDQRYGQIIDEARQSPGHADDLALARQLLIAAGDGAESEAMQLALIDRAMVLAGPLSTDEAVNLMRNALEQVHAIRPLSAATRAAFERDLAEKQMLAAQADRADAARLKKLGIVAAKAHLAYVKAVLPAEEIPRDTEAVLHKARVLITKYKDADLLEPLRDADRQLRRERTWRLRLKQAEVAFKSATERGDAAAILSASRVLGRVHLGYRGNVVAAAKYFSSAGDDEEKAVVAAASFLADPSTIKGDSRLDAAAKITQLAKTVEEPARRNLAMVARKMAQSYLDGRPSEVGGTKAKLLMGHLEVILRETPEDKFRNMLESKYGRLRCKLELLDGGRIRVTYDFSEAEQMMDWTVTGGQWEIGKNVLGCKTKQYSQGSIHNKLRFQADRPFRISVEAKARNEFGVQLNLKSAHGYASSLRFGLERYSGLKAYLAGYYWSDSGLKLKPDQPYRFMIANEADSGLKWSINGRQIVVPLFDQTKSRVSGRTFEVSLTTVSADFRLSLFDNLVIEGTVVAGADKKGATAKPSGSDELKEFEKSIREWLSDIN